MRNWTEAKWIESHLKFIIGHYDMKVKSGQLTHSHTEHIDHWMRKWWNADDEEILEFKPREIREDELNTAGFVRGIR